MTGKYWDIKPRTQRVIIPSQPAIPAEVYQEFEASRLPTHIMVKELWGRGVDIQTIFGMYYELEAIADAKTDEVFGNDEDGQHGRPPLTVGDAQLVGLTGEQIKLSEGKVF